MAAPSSNENGGTRRVRGGYHGHPPVRYDSPPVLFVLLRLTTGECFMKVSHQTLIAVSIGVLLCGAVAAQQNTAPSQSAPALAAIGPARPNRGNLLDKPAGVMPTVPPGFTVQVYAELQAPRMMVYA